MVAKRVTLMGNLEVPLRHIVLFAALLSLVLPTGAHAADGFSFKGRSKLMPGLRRCQVTINDNSISLERDRRILSDRSMSFSYKRLSTLESRIGLFRGFLIMANEDGRVISFRTRPRNARQAKELLQTKL